MWQRRSPAASIALAALLGAACSDGWEPPPTLLEDPQIVALDATAPHFDFHRQTGSLLLGQGWSQPTPPGPGDRRRAHAWALDGRAVIHVEAVSDAEVDLFVQCRPFHFEGTPGQSLTVVMEDRRLEPVPLAPGWQSLRVPLPRESLGQGLQEIALEFAHATRPADVSSSGDRRRLSAAFSAVGLVPREVGAPMRFLRAASLDPEARRITIPAAGGFSLPLPSGVRGRLLLAGIGGSCSDCRVVAELLMPGGGVRPLSSVPVTRREMRIAVTTPPGPPSRLRIRAGREGAPDAGEVVHMNLPGLRLRRPPTAPPPPSPHIFIYLIDTLRADGLEPYDAPPGSSPRIAGFAADAVTYRDAWTASSWTLPATVSVLTGLLPSTHGVMKGDVKLTADGANTLAALLEQRGYDTVGISQSFVASQAFGVDTGFDTFLVNDYLNSPRLGSQRIRRYLLQWLLSREAPAPVFAYLHSVDPHAPYRPPAEYRRRHEALLASLPESVESPAELLQSDRPDDPERTAALRTLYQGEVLYADRQFGLFLDLLRYLGLYDESLIVLVSDHGEEFREHGGLDHGRTVYEEMLRVPLVVRYPGGAWAGTVVDRRVSTLDLAPTILVQAGAVRRASALPGRDLRPDLVEEERPRAEPTLSEVSPMASELYEAVDYKALSVGDLKCVWSGNRRDQFGRAIPPIQAWDLGEDPQERRPLGPGDPRLELCQRLLQGWLSALAQEGRADAPTSEQTLEALRALGYIE